MGRKFYIKNLLCNKSVLIIDNNKKFYTDNIDNKKKFNNSLYNFDISNLNKLKNDIYSLNINNTIFYLIFSNKYSDSALFFNIVIRENNKFYLLKFDYYNIVIKKKQFLKKYAMKTNNILDYKFIKNKKFIFYFSYKKENLCKIKLNNKQNVIKHYVKIPIIRNDINRKNISYCKLNNDDIANTVPINEYDINCNFLKNIDNKNNKKLEKCSYSKKNYLITEIPSIKKIIINLLNKKYIMNAGKIKENLEIKQNNIDKKLQDSSISELTNELNHTLDDSYKLILSDTVNDFSNYLNDQNISTKTHDVKKISKAYKELLLDIKERNSEYKLIKKYNICNNAPIKTYCPVKNLLNCQKLCNNNDNCRFISYNSKNNKCKLFNKCIPTSNYKYNTFVKKSLLRNEGYNWINRFLLSRNLPIPERPLWVDVLFFIASIIFVISLASIGARLFIIVFKFIYCLIWSDACYYPTEILTLNENKNIYI